MRRFVANTTLLLFLAFTTSIALLAPSKINAADEQFSTTLETTYDVGETGATQITHKFIVTNKTPTTFLKQYGLKLHSTSVENIVVKNNNQEIKPEISTTDNTTSVLIDFPDDVVGEGKKRNFSISYATKDIATVAGKVLEVHVPPLSSSEQYSSHKIILKTPLIFGRATRVSPEPTAVTIESKTISTVFDQPKTTSISAFFGDEQFYKMTLRYNLKNESSSAGIAQIALPPDTPYQRMHFYSLEPPTNDIKVDPDGNWIASYVLEPQSKLPVYLTAAVKLTLEPNSHISVVDPLPEHTESTKYWESDNTAIQDRVQLIKTPAEIYKTVIDSLEYSYATLESTADIPRLGAVGAFEKPSDGVCQEYTDAFIAMARANNIPARRLGGYAHTENTKLRPLSLQGDILHAWPEFYDAETKRWRQVDPTWGDTTGGIDYFNQFDLSHIVFVINGISSTTPYPAGSYKTDEENTKDVDVSFTNEFPTIKPEIAVAIQPHVVAGSDVPGMYQLVITNKTGQAWYDMDIVLQVSEAAVNAKLVGENVHTILPNQVLTIPLQLTTATWSLPTKTAVKLSITIPEYGTLYDQTTELTSGPNVVTKIKDANAVIGVVVGVTILTIGAGSILVFRRSGKSSIRRQSQKPQTPGDIVQLPQETIQPNPPTGNNSPPSQVQNPQ